MDEYRELGKINYSGNIEGDEIHLKDVLASFKKFKLKEPFVYIVGGLCNHGKTCGDIDILIKKSRPVNEEEDIPLKFRIMRQLDKKYWHRLHFLYDDEMHGPFTNYVPLYSLICEVNTKEVHEMSEDFSQIERLGSAEQAAKSRAQNKILPFRFFMQPKPVHGREKTEIYSLDSIEETMSSLKNWKEAVNKGIYLEKKFDGVRCQAHKVGKKVLILTEEGTDVTKKIPTIADEFRKRKEDFVVEFEVELWLKGKHQNRADSAGVLLKKDSEDEKFMIANLYDCLWFEGEDIHDKLYPERRVDLEKVGSSERIKVSEAKLTKGFSSIKRMSKRFMSLPGSEGVIYKLPAFIYELDGKSFNFMKFKKERSIIAKVIAVNKVRGTEKTFYYHCAIEGDTFVGKTFNTNIAVKAGEKLEVVFVDLNQYTDPKTKKVWFNWWSPRVIAKSRKSLTTIEQAKKLVTETSGQIGVKKLPKISREELHELLTDDGKVHSYEELSFKKKFVFQNHYRGKSVHGDLRFERDGHLEGYTLMHQVEGEIKEPVMNIQDGKREDSDDKNFKINLKTGELKQEKIEIATKAQQPKVWLDIAPGISLSGMEAGVGKRPEPGATAKFPGVFTKIDSGTYEEGARKPQYFEYFLNGKVFNGRYIVRVLGAERIKGEEAKRPFVWFFWKPKDQTPYVLSSRGIRKEYVPEKGRSALPGEWEKKIPKELQWWKKKLSGEKALEIIREIRKLLLEKEELEVSGAEENLNSGAETQFKLKHDWWKGQFVIRGLPVEHWSVKFKSKGFPYFTLNKNPLEVDKGIIGIKKKGSKSLYDLEGIIPAGKPPNPNKKIPMRIDVVDEGTAQIIEDTEDLLRVQFKGKKLKGEWVFKKTNNIWNVSKGESQSLNSDFKEFGAPMSQEEIRKLYFLSENNVGPSEIGRILDRPFQTIYSWQKKLNLG